MRYLHTIEATDTPENPTWHALGPTGDPEDYDGTAADYGRDVLRGWIDDNPDTPLADTHGNPTLRVIVAFADDPHALASAANRVVVVECDDLDEPDTDIAAVEAARERKLYAALLDALADDALTDALAAARAAGHGANRLADLAYPAVSRPIALRMMKTKKETPMTAPPVTFTLGYEMEGSTDAAWVIREQDDDNTIWEVNAVLAVDDIDAAQEWATAYLAQHRNMTVAEWQPHHPGPGTDADYWTAIPAT